jgi:hypothetical protein
MRKIWKTLGGIFDFLEPFAVALDAPVAWILTVASVAIGVITVSAFGGITTALWGSAWFLIAYAMCPTVKAETFYKAIACTVAILIINIMGTLAS